MGVWDPSAQDETGCPGNLIQRLQPRKLVGRCGWVQKAGKEWLARREPLLAHLGRLELQPTLARMLCLFGESRERGEDKRAVFLSFLFN